MLRKRGVKIEAVLDKSNAKYSADTFLANAGLALVDPGTRHYPQQDQDHQPERAYHSQFQLHKCRRGKERREGTSRWLRNTYYEEHKAHSSPYTR